MLSRKGAPPRFTWATLPTVANWPSFSPVFITDVGVGGSLWHHNGTYWRPVSGSVQLGRNIGSLATPLATITGNGTNQSFAMPGGYPVVPANMLIAGSSVIDIFVHLRKRGTTSTPIDRVYFGTAGTTGDSLVVQLGHSTAANNSDMRFGQRLMAVSAGLMLADYGLAALGSITNGLIDVSTNINFAAAMTFTVAVTSSLATGDFLDLVEFGIIVTP